MRNLTLSLLPLIFLSSCIQTTGLGPELGLCSSPPDVPHTFGEIGIGSCLSGPADLEFFDADGDTWLAVSNANPFLNFEGGSLLLIDWSSLSARIDAGEQTVLVSDLTTSAMPMDSYVGGIGHVEDQGVLLVAGRYTADSLITTDDDEVFIIDVTDPASPEPWSRRASIEVRADPQPVVIDADEDRAYVINISDQSISVIDTTSSMELVDVAPDARLVPDSFDDADSSGSVAEISEGTILVDNTVTQDQWTLEWVDASYRLWVPTDDGLDRWISGGSDYLSTTLGVVPSETERVDTPYAVLESGVPGLYFSDGDQILRLFSDGTAGGWNVSAAIPLITANEGAWDETVDSPSPVTLNTEFGIYYAGTDASGVSSVGVAWWTGLGNDFISNPEPVLTAPTGSEIAHPFAVYDPRTDTVRIWMSLWNGDSWSIGHASSTDGETFSEIEQVLSLTSGHVAAPTLAWVQGRYVLWMATGDGTAWQHDTAWSWNGLDWSLPEPAMPSDRSFDLMDPPRVGALADATSGWSVQGDNSGFLSVEAFAGSTYLSTAHGFSFRATSGHEASWTSLTATDAELGIRPVSFTEGTLGPRMYVTATDVEGNTSIALMSQEASGWDGLAENLIPGGRDPVVFDDDGTLRMIYASTDDFGVTRMFSATSTNGLGWTTSDEILLESGEDFDSFAQYPHSVQLLGDGQIRVWYTGSNGSRLRIAAASGDIGGTLQLERGDRFAWQFEAGSPGAFDDADVSDPVVIDEGGVEHLYYTGYNGTSHSIGHATRSGADLDWTREPGRISDEPQPAISGQAGTFSAFGVSSPVLVPTDNFGWELWYAGNDGISDRVGRANGDLDQFFETQAFPTVGDTLGFSTHRGETGEAVIELSQFFDDVALVGTGLTEARLDDDRGVLWVTTSVWNYIYAIDVRDDSVAGAEDSNYLDIEAILMNGATIGRQGFRDAIAIPGTDLLYATVKSPDQLLVFDLSEFDDDGRKDALQYAPVATFSLQAQRTPTETPSRLGIVTTSRDEDEGSATWTQIGGSGLALTEDGQTLLVSHFRDNSVEVWDLGIGPYGEPIAKIPTGGENPHRIEITPDGSHAVVANYVGEIEGSTSSSSLSVIDLDPTSDTYLSVVITVVNR